MGEKGLKDRLLNVIHNEFAQITYTDAVALLQKEIKVMMIKMWMFIDNDNVYDLRLYSNDNYMLRYDFRRVR